MGVFYEAMNLVLVSDTDVYKLGCFKEYWTTWMTRKGSLHTLIHDFFCYDD